MVLKVVAKQLSWFHYIEGHVLCMWRYMGIQVPYFG